MRIRPTAKYAVIAVYAFLVVAASIFLFYISQNLSLIGKGLSVLSGILSPFVWGFCIAYVLNYPYKRLMTLMLKGKKTMHQGIRKALSITCIYVAFIAFIFILSYFVVPRIISAIIEFTETIPHYTSMLSVKATDFLMDYLARYDISARESVDIVTQFFDNFKSFFDVQSIIKNIVDFIIAVSVGLKNFFLGLIISVYFLIDKEKFCSSLKKLTYVILPEEKADETLEFLRYTDKTFGEFIIANVVNSAIIGGICYVGMIFMGLEYAMVISILVGVTNLIPFFGPFIGAVPAALLLFIINPWHALMFVIFITILQQFDGNVLGPKLMGRSMGIRSVFVIFAVILGGGLFGIVGMFISVPLFAVIYNSLSRVLNRKFKEKSIENQKN